ncbi:CBS domain-containing protein [Streptomyces niger]|uniref:CBS domain-containing protein n=1 Tax=Streptomyces niger TaxID=66373 RepID=UPI000699DEF9|nr:CBS domain-containing protein [Streptomyces niger]
MHHRSVSDIMNRDVVTAEPGMVFKDIAYLFAHHRISGIPVVDGDGKVLGVVSETDLMARQTVQDDERPHRFPRLSFGGARAVRTKSRATTVTDLMTKPAITVGPRQSLVEAARVMARHHCNRLPVIDAEGRLMGIVTRGDLLGVFLRSDDDIRKEVVDEVLVRTLWLEPHTIDVSVHGGTVTLSGTLQRRSEIPLALRLTSRIDGVVEVIDHLGYQEDDSRLRPSEQALHGITEEWLRRI